MDKQPLAQKCAIQFEKTGSACFYSHHDLMRLFERGLRRAAIPVRLTEGFNPRPRLVFPHPLGLGVASLCEEIEIELSSFCSFEDLIGRLRAAIEPVIRLRRIVALPPTRKGRIVSCCTYRLGPWPDAAKLEDAAAALLQESRLAVERGHGRKRRMLDVRPYLAEIEIEGSDCMITLRHTPKGAGRADEIAHLLAGITGADVSEIRIEKIHMAFAGA